MCLASCAACHLCMISSVSATHDQSQCSITSSHIVKLCNKAKRKWASCFLARSRYLLEAKTESWATRNWFTLWAVMINTRTRNESVDDTGIIHALTSLPCVYHATHGMYVRSKIKSGVVLMSFRYCSVVPCTVWREDKYISWKIMCMHPGNCHLVIDSCFFPHSQAKWVLSYFSQLLANCLHSLVSIWWWDALLRRLKKKAFIVKYV